MNARTLSFCTLLSSASCLQAPTQGIYSREQILQVEVTMCFTHNQKCLLNANSVGHTLNAKVHALWLMADSAWNTESIQHNLYDDPRQQVLTEIQMAILSIANTTSTSSTHVLLFCNTKQHITRTEVGLSYCERSATATHHGHQHW